VRTIEGADRQVHETAADLVDLQSLLDRSMAAAGPHLASVVTPDRLIGARELCARLEGMRLLTVATATADGRPLASAVDGIFYRGAFHFGTAPNAVKIRHLRARPHLSAVHLPGEHFAVTVHGTAEFVDLRDAAAAGLRQTILDIYAPQYGSEWEEFMDSEAVYVRIAPRRMFVFWMDPGSAGQPD
jgi:hypothetical protein